MTADALINHLTTALDPSSRTPRYEQLAQALRRAIQSGLLPPGAVLPPEPELATRLGLSRQTVNQALTGLARRGVLTRRRGVGTFVAEPAIEQPLDGLYSFLRTLTAQGRLPGTRVLGYRLTVDQDAALTLTGEAEHLVFELSRLRLVDGVPLAMELVYLAVAHGERLPLDRVAQVPLYDLLQEVCGITVTHAHESLRPVTVAQPEATLLGLRVGEPAFLVERTAYAGEQAVEVRRSLIRGDRYRFRVHLAGPQLAASRE
jgi:GntR family transcriptional regulator